MKLLRKIIIWGTADAKSAERTRHIILSNYLGLAISFIGFLILTVDAIEVPENFPDYEIDSVGALLFTLSGLTTLILNRFYFTNVSRFIISVFPITCLIMFPLMVGKAIDEFYFWYPYALVFASLKPQLTFSFKFEKVVFLTLLSYYLILLLFIDNILIYYATDEVWLLPIIREHRLFYKLVPLLSFIFTTSVITYFKVINSRFEQDLTDTNEELLAIIEELKATQQHLIQSEKMASLGTLVSGIAHELNNPLNHITGGATVLTLQKDKLKNNCSEEVFHNWELATSMLNSGVKHATGVIKALMTFSYKGTPRLSHFPLREIIDNTLMFINNRIPSEIEVITHYRLLRTVAVYPEKIHQVLIAMLENAIFAANEISGVDKFIKIETYEMNGNANLKITNSGKPIPEEYINQVFDPFFTTKEPGEGIGLGLSICHTLVAEHNGKISIENQTNAVSFIIELPLSHK